MPVFTSSKKRIAFFYLYADLEAYAFLRDSLKMLVERGYSVDIFSPSFNVPRFPLEGVSAVQMFGHPEAYRYFTILPRWILKLRKGGRPYKWLVEHLYYPLANFFFKRFLRRRHAQSPYACVIGEDPPGLLAASAYAELLGIPMVYWSFELFFADETTYPPAKALKAREVKASRAAAFTIIQDEWRGKALCEENGIAEDTLVYLPNAPRGKARRQRSDYLQRRLKINPARKIILYAGRLGKWTLSHELAQAAANWGQDYVLVLQSHIPREEYPAAYISQLERLADPAHVALSFDPVPAAHIREMMDSAEVGLALYAPQNSGGFTDGRNVYLMGLSSSKLAGFLHSGLPVIVNDAVLGPKELVEKWTCGISVNQPEEIGAALETIFRDYDTYSQNAVRCFNEELELEARFGQVISKIGRL